MIVVADASPLLYLSRLGELELIRRVYGRVVVPLTVWRELVEARPDVPGADALRAAAFIDVSDRAELDEIPEELVAELDAGEAAAIWLAELESAALLLIDERKGRSLAQARGIRVRGTIGTIVEARRAGVLVSVRPLLVALARVGFRASPALTAWAIEQAGEDSEEE